MMDFLLDVDWEEVFALSISPLEGIVRISIVYLFLFFLIRFVLKREAASLGISDLLVVVLIADAVQNAMSDDYRSVTDGLILGSTLIFWNWVLSYAAMRWQPVRRILLPAPLLLVRYGEMIKHNLSQEHLTEEEIFSTLRENGIEDIKDVKFAFMETDGRISVIPKEGKESQPPSPRDEQRAA
jgi:uncharacterized membrane protein YcaP (DUF421 family)